MNRVAKLTTNQPPSSGCSFKGKRKLPKIISMTQITVFAKASSNDQVLKFRKQILLLRFF